MEEKTVDFETYWKAFGEFKHRALKELDEKCPNPFALNFYELQGGVYDDGRPVKIGVSIGAMLTLEPEMTRRSARALTKAASLAESFKYNGYIVKL